MHGARGVRGVSLGRYQPGTWRLMAAHSLINVSSAVTSQDAAQAGGFAGLAPVALAQPRLRHVRDKADAGSISLPNAELPGFIFPFQSWNSLSCRPTPTGDAAPFRNRFTAGIAVVPNRGRLTGMSVHPRGSASLLWTSSLAMHDARVFVGGPRGLALPAAATTRMAE